MKANQRRTLGMLLAVLGILIVVFSEKIVFPGLEALVGIETIVGRKSVVYQDDGGYLFTNPGAMTRWMLSVAVVGVGFAAFGAWLWWKARNCPSKS